MRTSVPQNCLRYHSNCFLILLCKIIPIQGMGLNESDEMGFEADEGARRIPERHLA